MTNEKIVISFDGDDELKSDTEKITVNTIAEVKNEENQSQPEPVFNPRRFSHYRGNPSLNGFYDCGISFPQSSDNCFRVKYSFAAGRTFSGEGFLNSILEYGENLVLSSLNGNIYFVDRNDGSIKKRISFPGESFEKTGVVADGNLYQNSLKKIFKISAEGDYSVIYETLESYIWSGLNYCNGKISFLIFNPDKNFLESDKEKKFVLIDTDSNDCITTILQKKGNLCDKVVVAAGNHFVILGDTLFSINDNGVIRCQVPLGFNAGFNTLFFSLRNHLYFNSPDNELYFTEAHLSPGGVRYSGIKTSGVMYAVAFDDNIFIGTGSGWSLYKSGGQLIYSFDDICESVTECLNSSILVILKKEKITFHNLAKFYEADTFLIPAGGNIDVNDYFVSSILSDGGIFALTRYGKIFAFSNDKMNLKL